MVLQGSLIVEDYEIVADRQSAQPRFIGSTVLEEGQSCAFAGTEGHAHRCTNVSARRPAVTLHVYGGLLDTYRNFEATHDGRYAMQSTVARIDGGLGQERARGA